MTIAAATRYVRFYQTVAHVPGLRYFPEFIDRIGQKKIVEQANALHQSIVGQGEQKSSAHKSKAHNLSSEEKYKLILLDDPTGRRLNAQYFDRYGDEGHTLTYFIDNKNIPEFVQKELICRVEQVKEVQNLKKAGNPLHEDLNWRLTFNTYSRSKSSLLPGFPFHTDLPENGDITMIFSLLSEANLQLRRDTLSHSIRLKPGSLLLLTDEVRWHWQHRLMPQEIKGENGTHLDGIQRMSLVLGCRKIEACSKELENRQTLSLETVSYATTCKPARQQMHPPSTNEKKRQ